MDVLGRAVDETDEAARHPSERRRSAYDRIDAQVRRDRRGAHRRGGVRRSESRRYLPGAVRCGAGGRERSSRSSRGATVFFRPGFGAGLGGRRGRGLRGTLRRGIRPWQAASSTTGAASRDNRREDEEGGEGHSGGTEEGHGDPDAIMIRLGMGPNSRRLECRPHVQWRVRPRREGAHGRRRRERLGPVVLGVDVIAGEILRRPWRSRSGPRALRSW